MTFDHDAETVTRTCADCSRELTVTVFATIAERTEHLCDDCEYQRREDAALKVFIGPWRFVWHGGRLADIYHAEASSALSCVQVSALDDHDQITDPFTVATLLARAERWVSESAGEIIEHELPYAEA